MGAVVGVLRRSAAVCAAVCARCVGDTRPWHERQPLVLWQAVFDSGYVTPMDARRCVLVCRQWRQCIRYSPALRRRLDQYNARGAALRIVFNRGYLNHDIAYSCMRVSRQWYDCVHNAHKLWRRIHINTKRWHRDEPRRRTQLANWTDAMPRVVAVKNPMELVFSDFHATPQQLAAILGHNPQVQHVEFRQMQMYSFLRSRDPDIARLVHVAPMLTQLKVLHLRWHGRYGDATAQLIAATFTQLHELDVSCSKITSAGVRHLSNIHARTRTTLRKLHLTGCEFIVCDISECILGMPNLEELGVESIPVCTEQWASTLKQKYAARHLRQIVVRTSCRPWSLADC